MSAFEAAVTTVATSTTVATIIGDSYRQGLVVYNDAAADMLVKLGPGASPTSFSFRIPANSAYETTMNYTGVVTAVLASGSGTARVTTFD